MRLLANLLVTLGLGYLALVFAPVLKTQITYWWAWHGQEMTSARQTFGQVLGLYQKSSFGQLLQVPPPLKHAPVNPNGAVVIDKINVNAPIVWDVPVANKKAYLSALGRGVAHASLSAKPSEKQATNTYLFAHSTLNPLEIKKYSASFTLLNKLSRDDLVVVFADGKRYDYRVRSTRVVSGFDLAPLTRQVEKPTLTLQTCDPPGVPLNRLIVSAELEKVWGRQAENTKPETPKAKPENRRPRT